MSSHRLPKSGHHGRSRGSPALPPVCYIRHAITGETVEIHRGETGYHSIGTLCSPECLNRRLPHPPTEDEIRAMRDHALRGWEVPEADPRAWRLRREAGE